MQPLRFGVVSHTLTHETRPLLEEWLSLVGPHARMRLEVAYAHNYDTLATHLVEGFSPVAWVPPVVFLELERHGLAVALTAHPRGANAHFCSVFITGDTSSLRTLASVPGARVAWVERWSASGYVVPRLSLFDEGIDPRVAFGGERFFGSHEAVVRAVIGGKADVGATYASADSFGRIVTGPWSNMTGAAEAIRVLAAWTEIPSDLIAISTRAPEHLRVPLANAMVEVSASGRGAALVRRIFGVDRMIPWAFESYEPLRTRILRGAELGLLGALSEEPKNS